MRLSRRLAPLVKAFHERGIQVSLFVDPVPAQLAAAEALGARIVELHTGRYADARTPEAAARELTQLQRAARRTRGLGLAVAAGHGLDYENVRAVAAIPEIEELNIGFSIITRALSVGLESAVREMAARLLLEEAHAIPSA